MNIKKLLLWATAFSGMVATGLTIAAPSGTASMITNARIICSGTLTGDVPLSTVIGAGQQKGIESSWLINNTSTTDTLAITRIDSYGMDGQLLVSLTPTSAPDLPTQTNHLFNWTVLPYQVVRFPHDFSMIYPNTATGTAGTAPSLVRWYSVVFTLANAGGRSKPISAPLVTGAMVERGDYTQLPSATTPGLAPVVSRTRNECVYMM